MRGLYISFVIKRRKKIDKIMDYFLAVAGAMFLFVFAFYVQYVQKENKYNSSYKNLQSLNTELDELKDKLNAKQQENSSTLEKSYNTAYSELVTSIEDVAEYTSYIKDIYSARIKGVTINGVKIDSTKGVISLSLSFDRSSDSQVDYRYRAALLDYDWIPVNGIEYSDTNITTTWQITVASEVEETK